MLALFAAVSLGVAFGGLVGAVFTGDWIYTVVASIAFAIGSLAGAFAAFGTYTGGLRARSSDGLTLPGEMALARVEGIRRTGLSVNDQPQVELTLTVAPRTRPAYTTVHREIVDIVALPQLQPGSIIVVRRPEADKANVMTINQWFKPLLEISPVGARHFRCNLKRHSSRKSNPHRNLGTFLGGEAAQKGKIASSCK